MKKIFIYTFIIFIISSTKSFACNYSTGIIASFKKEHKICSKLVKSKPYLDKWQKSDLYHDCRCELYWAKFQDSNKKK